jgi:hypothetical protein
MRCPAQILVLLLLSGCASPGKEVLTWEEEAMLADGRVITVSRRLTLGDGAFPVSRRGPILQEEFCYRPLHAYFASKRFGPPADVQLVGDRLYVTVLLRDCFACSAGGIPSDSSAYLEFRDGAWVPIAKEEYPAATRRNLMIHGFLAESAHLRDPTGLVTLAEKSRRDAGLRDRTAETQWRYELGFCNKTCSQVTPYASNAKFDFLFPSDGGRFCQ